MVSIWWRCGRTFGDTLSHDVERIRGDWDRVDRPQAFDSLIGLNENSAVTCWFSLGCLFLSWLISFFCLNFECDFCGTEWNDSALALSSRQSVVTRSLHDSMPVQKQNYIGINDSDIILLLHRICFLLPE